MKLVRLILVAEFALIFLACGGQMESFPVVNSESFNVKQIVIGGSLSPYLRSDSLGLIMDSSALTEKLEKMIRKTEALKKDSPDSVWNLLDKSWQEFQAKEIPSFADTSVNALQVFQKWAGLNIRLLKLTSEARFGDALEKLMYDVQVPVLSESEFKSVIYTRIDDQIFINIIGSSTLIHQHTTGGAIKLIQETAFPSSDEMILKCECSDVRYLDVFIRIPEWSVNPTVSHGNVKYVARPGEYCQISRKWKDGDEFLIKLKN